MTRIEVTSVLHAPLSEIWEHVNTTRLLDYVARGWIAFRPIDPPVFPARWEEREYLVAMSLRGVLPIGRQVIGIERPAPADGKLFVRDNGRSASIRSWDHLITIEPAGEGATRYTDRLDLDAGPLTAALTVFARSFYAHRQRRWARLVASGFDYSL